MTQEQDKAFAAALRELYAQYPVERESLIKERAVSLERIDSGGSVSAYRWALNTGVPNALLASVATLIYGEVP